jgi:hypothetical protein
MFLISLSAITTPVPSLLHDVTSVSLQSLIFTPDITPPPHYSAPVKGQMLNPDYLHKRNGKKEKERKGVKQIGNVG